MYVQSSDSNDGDEIIHVLVDSKHINKENPNTNIQLYIRGVCMPSGFEANENSNDTFLLSDTVCEELINLAVIFACRNVQDPRLATVVQTKSLEA